MTTTVVAICGSLRDGSHTRTALEHVLDAAAEAGAETELLDLREYDLPVYDPDVDEQGDSQSLVREVREADAVVLGSPTYHGSYSGALKNFHDYCSFDEFEETTVGLLTVAGGSSYASTLDHMRITVRGVHGWVLPHQVGIENVSDQFEDGEFVDSALEERVRGLGTKLVRYAHIHPDADPATAEADD